MSRRRSQQSPYFVLLSSLQILAELFYVCSNRFGWSPKTASLQMVLIQLTLLHSVVVPHKYFRPLYTCRYVL